MEEDVSLELEDFSVTLHFRYGGMECGKDIGVGRGTFLLTASGGRCEVHQVYQIFNLAMHKMLFRLQVAVLIFDRSFETSTCFDCVCLPDLGRKLEAVRLLSHRSPV